jgi:hypothetical protein
VKRSEVKGSEVTGRKGSERRKEGQSKNSKPTATLANESNG